MDWDEHKKRDQLICFEGKRMAHRTSQDPRWSPPAYPNLTHTSQDADVGVREQCKYTHDSMSRDEEVVQSDGPLG